jgi:GrpB-like predicted nucleotidyltransferase (UPF0157 family)
MRKIEVVDYDPCWPKTFEYLRSRIWTALGDVLLSAEPVGSTSVPGLAAKPIIDISIVVSEGSDVQTGISRLATLGYMHRDDLGVDEKLSPIRMACPCTICTCVPEIALRLPTILRFEITYAPIQKQRGSMVNSINGWRSVFRMTLTVISTVRLPCF